MRLQNAQCHTDGRKQISPKKYTPVSHLVEHQEEPDRDGSWWGQSPNVLAMLNFRSHFIGLSLDHALYVTVARCDWKHIPRSSRIECPIKIILKHLHRGRLPPENGYKILPSIMKLPREWHIENRYVEESSRLPSSPPTSSLLISPHFEQVDNERSLKGSAKFVDICHQKFLTRPQVSKKTEFFIRTYLANVPFDIFVNSHSSLGPSTRSHAISTNLAKSNSSALKWEPFFMLKLRKNFKVGWTRILKHVSSVFKFKHSTRVSHQNKLSLGSYIPVIVGSLITEYDDHFLCI